MRIPERRPRRLACALASVFALGLLGSPIAADDFERSWDERSSGGAGGSTSAAPAPAATKPKASPAPAAPTPPPTRKPSSKPTPDPKKLSKADFACKMLNATVDEAIKDIESKRSQGSSANQTPLDHEYDKAYKEAVEDLKKEKSGASQAELDAAGKKAAREAVRKAFVDGKVTAPTGETFADSFRRQAEGAKRGKDVPAPSTKVPANASPYMKQCAKEGVPLPPPWGDPGWVSEGKLAKGTVLAFQELPNAEVFVSRTPQGVCIALPRADEKDTIRQLDQICQGKDGKACFWSNVSPKDGETFLKVVDGLDPANIAGGDKLGLNCTRCHRGDNAFIIRPGTPLQLGPDDPCEKKDPGSRFGPTDPDKRFQPIGRGRDPKQKDPNEAAPFENPKDLFPLGDRPCSACHGIPKPSPSYCAQVLLPMIINGEMPPKSLPPAPPPNPADFKKDIEDIKAACQKAFDADSIAP